MKINLDYLKQVLPELPEFADPAKFANQLYAVNGYDEATGVVEQLRDVEYPVVLVEDIPSGVIKFQDAYTNHKIISLSIMNKADSLEPAARRKAYEDSLAIGRQLLRRLVRDNAGYEGEGEYWDTGRVQYFPRGPIASQVFGYEFMLNVVENIDLSMEG